MQISICKVRMSKYVCICLCLSMCLWERKWVYVCVKLFHNLVVNQNERGRLWGVLVHGLEEGGESATHVIACSSWQCLQCGRAVACWFTHTRHGNMHVRISFPSLASVKTKLFKTPALLPSIMIACWETRSGWGKVKGGVNWATFMSIAELHRKAKSRILW